MDNSTTIQVAGRSYTAEVLSYGWPFKVKFTSDSKLQEGDFEAVGCASATPGEVAEFSACGWSRTSMPGGWYVYTLELISPQDMQELRQARGEAKQTGRDRRQNEDQEPAGSVKT